MKKVFLVTLLYMAAIYAGNNGLIAQNSEKPKRIEVSGGLFKTYYVGSEKIKDLNRLESVLRSVNDPGVNAELSAAKDWQIAGIVFSSAGGFLIGYYLGGLLFDNDPDKKVLFFGLGGTTIGMVLGSEAEKHVRKAIDKYNAIVASYNIGKSNFSKFSMTKFNEERTQWVGKRVRIILNSSVETTGLLAKNYEEWIALQLDDGSMSNIALEDVREILLPEDKADKDPVVEEEKAQKHTEKEKLTGKRMRIMLNSSVVIKGTVISEDAKWIVLKRADGGISNIARSDIREMIPE